MTNENNPQRPLLPHQQALVDRFCEDSTVRGHVVRWDTGLGSVWTMALLIKNFVTANPAGRVLVLSPKILTEQIHYHLEAVELQADLVDRFRFRAMVDTETPLAPIWNEGGIYVLGTDFAKQGDIAASLCSVEWDLLIAPEAHQLRGQKEELVKSVVERSPEIKVLLLTWPGVDKLPKFGILHWNESTVRMREVVDASGRRIFDLPPPVLNSIEIAPDASECQLRQAVAGLVQLLRPTDENQRLLGIVIENSMQSSLSALEGTLRRIRNQLVHGSIATFQGTDEQDDDAGANNIPPLPLAENRALLAALEKCLAEVESISVDPKLEGLTQLIEEIHEEGVFPRSTCILTKYLATVAYVQTALDERGFITFGLNGSIDFDDKIQELEECRINDGILIATTASLEGLSMPEVKSLILYDLPKSPLILRQILGRFQRFGRSAPLKIYVFNDQKGIDVFREIIHECADEEIEEGRSASE